MMNVVFTKCACITPCKISVGGGQLNMRAHTKPHVKLRSQTLNPKPKTKNQKPHAARPQQHIHMCNRHENFQKLPRNCQDTCAPRICWVDQALKLCASTNSDNFSLKLTHNLAPDLRLVVPVRLSLSPRGSRHLHQPAGADYYHYCDHY